jgi:hypothetical protein
MQDFVRALRFFLILELSHPVVTAGLAIVTAASIVAIVVEPLLASAVVFPVLMLQVLASSSGFAPAARRGHYDLPLTLGLARSAIGLAHWCVSAWPGVVAWLLVALTELAVGAGPPRVMRYGQVAMLLVSSTLPWALTVPFPRLTGGLALTVAGLSLAGVVPVDVRTQWANLLQGAEAEAAAIGSVTAAVVMLVALQFIHRMDVPLEAQ